MIKKTMEDKPHKWHETLSKVLWAYRNAKCTTIDFTPYQLTYGQEVILPLEISMKSLRVAKQNELELDDYHKALFMELDLVDED